MYQKTERIASEVTRLEDPELSCGDNNVLGGPNAEVDQQ